ncbi:unnamed protein product [Cuscuta epithymum]|uniref:Uncharacterized protein n=1 Tax=Cuscuta epithymum TaxID=186058 RepID=A0AAV0G829_9ASTE|nr:unnamed protein product [Cuscuta epithymum]
MPLKRFYLFFPLSLFFFPFNLLSSSFLFPLVRRPPYSSAACNSESPIFLIPFFSFFPFFSNLPTTPSPLFFNLFSSPLLLPQAPTQFNPLPSFLQSCPPPSPFSFLSFSSSFCSSSPLHFFYSTQPYIPILPCPEKATQ